MKFKIGDKIRWSMNVSRPEIKGQLGEIVNDNYDSENPYQAKVLTGKYAGRLLFGSGEYYEITMNRNGANR